MVNSQEQESIGGEEIREQLFRWYTTTFRTEKEGVEVNIQLAIQEGGRGKV